MSGESELGGHEKPTKCGSFLALPTAPLVSEITYRSNSVTRMTTTKSFDYLNRLQSISSQPGASGTAPIGFGYLYNDANQRTRRTDPDGSAWAYDYDNLGQVTSGKRYWPDQTPVAGQQFEYAYDDIGNRTSAKTGADASGADSNQSIYSVNALNQNSIIYTPGTANVMGIAHANAAVTVNGQSAYRKGEYYWQKLSVDTSAGPAWPAITNVASLSGASQTNIGNLLVRKSAEYCWHDLDGNLLSDGAWTNTWNGENRMTATENTAAVPTGVRARETWAFDGSGRWVQRIVYTWNGSAYVASYTNRFVWDDKVLLAMLDHTNGLVMAFQRGLDLSGSLQGAGGVGGLLAVNIRTNGVHFGAYDGNGNIAALVSGTDGSLSGTYEYDPFANPLRTTGMAAKANPIRFSTQFVDEVTGNLKYLYRDYQPMVGRWPSRDSMGELADKQLYGFVRNGPISQFDQYGNITVGQYPSFESSGCGGFSVGWLVGLDNPAPCNGYLVQVINKTISGKYCDDKSFSESITYWEAIPVAAGKFAGVFQDSWGHASVTRCGGTKGTLTMTGSFKFYCESAVGNLGNLNQPSPAPTYPSWTPGEWHGGNPNDPGCSYPMSSGAFPSTGTTPPFWSTPPEESGGSRSVEITWDCCCSVVLEKWKFGN